MVFDLRTDQAIAPTRTAAVERLTAPAWRHRLLARAARLRLNRALSDGADPSASPLLAARAAQLCDRRTRRRNAEGLERLAGTADEPGHLFRIAPYRAAVRINAPRLRSLAAMLRSERVLYARGLAGVELLLTEGGGVAYTDRRGEALARALDLAHAGLLG